MRRVSLSIITIGFIFLAFNANAEFVGNLSVQQTQFISSSNLSYRQTSDDQFGQFSLGFNGTKTIYGKWMLNADANWLVSPAETQPNYYNVKEFSVTRPLMLGEITIGRHLHNWSYADQDWQSGMWQPRYSWSKMRPEQNGLFGLFANFDWHKNWNTTLLVSPIYVPDFGANFSLQNNVFVSENPWFVTPVSRVNLPFASDLPIHYSYSVPEISKIVFQEGFALQTRWQNQGNYCQVSLARKPISHIYLSAQFSIRYDLEEAPPGVEVNPFFNYHQLATGECGQENSQSSSYLSVTSESIDEQSNLNQESANKRTEDAQILAFDFKRYTKEYKKQHWSIGAMKLWGGDVEDGGANLLGEGKSLYERRHRYLEAVKLGFLNTSSFFGKELTYKTNFIYDHLQKAWTWSNDLEYGLKENFKVSLQADWLALAEKTDDKYQNGYFNLYKANDSVKLGCEYVF